MTIFLELAHKFLIPEIEKLRDDSVTKDNSFWNSARNYCWLGRNTDLSQEKQRSLNSLLQQVRDLNDQDNDSDTRTQLKTMFTNCLDQLDISRKKILNYGESKTEAGLESLITLIDAIYKKLNGLKVLNIKHDKDPLNCFRYYIALYFTQKIVNDRNQSIFELLVHDPHISRSRSMAANKEALIMGKKEGEDEKPSKIDACIAELNVIKDDLENREKKRNLIVIEFMKQLQCENLDLYQEHGTDLGVPINFSFFQPQEKLTKIQGRGGSLGVCLRAATAEIESNMAPVENLTDFQVLEQTNDRLSY